MTEVEQLSEKIDIEFHIEYPISMPESNKTSTTQIVCRDCRTNVGTVKCRCNKECMLCNTCATRTRERAVKNDWYLQYILWCDNCIWFDIS